MESKLAKVRAGRVSAVCVASLLLAANDLGYSTPLERQNAAQKTLCIAADDPEFPKIQYSKGQVQLRSATAGTDYNVQKPANGDTIATGADGFVSVRLTDGRYANVQPNSLVKFDSSLECQADNNDAVNLETPYLTAAIRG